MRAYISFTLFCTILILLKSSFVWAVTEYVFTLKTDTKVDLESIDQSLRAFFRSPDRVETVRSRFSNQIEYWFVQTNGKNPTGLPPSIKNVRLPSKGLCRKETQISQLVDWVLNEELVEEHVVDGTEIENGTSSVYAGDSDHSNLKSEFFQANAPVELIMTSWPDWPSWSGRQWKAPYFYNLWGEKWEDRIVIYVVDQGVDASHTVS